MTARKIRLIRAVMSLAMASVLVFGFAWLGIQFTQWLAR